MRVVYLIEIEHDHKWVPMYFPCYSQEEAERKEKLKAKTFGPSRVRISTWQWIGSGPLRESTPPLVIIQEPPVGT